MECDDSSSLWSGGLSESGYPTERLFVLVLEILGLRTSDLLGEHMEIGGVLEARPGGPCYLDGGPRPGGTMLPGRSDTVRGTMLRVGRIYRRLAGRWGALHFPATEIIPRLPSNKATTSRSSPYGVR